MKEFDRYLDKSSFYLRKVDPLDLISRIQSEGSRNALYTPSFNHLRSYGTSLKVQLDSPSSDEGSDDHQGFPSVYKVSERILDTNSITYFDSFIPTQHNPCILLAPISPDLKSHKITQILTNLGIENIEVQIIDFNIQYSKAVLLWFLSMEYINSYYEIIKERGQFVISENIMLIKWIHYKILDSEFSFFAVIMRGFHRRMTVRDINLFLPVSVKRCEIRIINNIPCAVIIMNTILDVCIVCRKINNTTDPFKNTVKVHPHPLTQKKYSRAMIETLISDLPIITPVEKKESFDVFKVLDLGLKTTRNSIINPLENLVKLKK